MRTVFHLANQSKVIFKKYKFLFLNTISHYTSRITTVMIISIQNLKSILVSCLPQYSF